MENTTTELLQHGLDFALKKIQDNQITFKESFPASSSDNLIYPKWDNDEWTPGFWTGLLWLAYDNTHDERYLESLRYLLPTFTQRLDEDKTLDTHDIGFIYTLSIYPAVLLFKNAEYREQLIRAAKRLMQRYNQTATIIQAWGDTKNPDAQGRIIIDSLLNLPILYEATALSGDASFKAAAIAHSKKVQQYLIRPDSSSFHTYYFDVLTGQPRFGKTAQGKSDASTWARGQAWAILGFAISYKHNHDTSLIETACGCADYYLQHLPADAIPYWDLSLKEENTQRDSSAAAILACGLLELCQSMPELDARRERYAKTAVRIVEELTRHYLTEGKNSNGILLHGVYSMPGNVGVDECTIWGDYFYVEALTRLTKVWATFW